MRNRPRFTTGLILILIALVFFLGCGSSKKESGGEDPVGVNNIGFIDCYNCHADGLLAKFAEEKIFSTWQGGPHGNYEGSDHQDHGVNNDGFPNYAYFSDETCKTCHDQLGDGLLLENFYLLKGVDYLGMVNRPVVACESCHGPGGNHYGVGPLPYTKPDPSRCGQCHNETFDHNYYHPEGDSIFEDYQSSPHAHSINEHTYVEGSATDVRARCSRCHTDEGANLYVQVVNGTATNQEIKDALDSKSNILNASDVQCRTCHDPHDPLKLLGEKASGLPETWSVEFKTCTSCHQLLKTDDSLHTEGYHDPNVNPYGDDEEIIVDTHYDNPATVDIEGYVVNPESSHSSSSGNTNSGTCRDCHNPHNADTTINKQWARSGHGGEILEVKEQSGRDGAVTEDEAAAWVHYDFKGSNRQACQRCHTATGFRNFANDPANYDPANNLFVATGEQREMLYCWACHTSNKGNIRDPGLFANISPYSTPADRIAAVPDVAGSNVCLSCHSGRGSGQKIKDSVYPDDILGSHFGSFNSHYLAAGGVLFRTIGYEFDGLDYENVSYFGHDKIGSEAAPNTGTNGPCVGCHMGTSESHLFSPVKHDSDGHITEIIANEKTCSNCHSGEHVITVEELEENEEGFEAALEALETQLAARGIYYGSGYPYFFTTPDPDQQNSGNRFTNWPDKDTLGAAFNLNMLSHEPGAFAHNRYYTKRLIYDSIDRLDDGVLNSSVGTTLGSGLAYDYLKAIGR